MPNATYRNGGTHAEAIEIVFALRCGNKRWRALTRSVIEQRIALLTFRARTFHTIVAGVKERRHENTYGSDLA
jgi:hypothetical protein